ncbi:hypothetical protein F6P93_05760 [Escherichia coli]|nr:hypothetical protein F6P93_05760 [Escherichia coli]
MLYIAQAEALGSGENAAPELPPYPLHFIHRIEDKGFSYFESAIRAFFSRQGEGMDTDTVGSIWRAAGTGIRKEIHPATRVTRKRLSFIAAIPLSQYFAGHQCIWGWLVQ